MEINDELEIFFLSNQCSDVEARFVGDYFNSHPDEPGRYVPLEELIAENSDKLGISLCKKILNNTVQGKRKKGKGSSLLIV